MAYKNEEIYYHGNEWIKDRTIYKCVGGSHAYGLNTPESDIDYRGVCIPPKRFFFGLQGFEQQVLETPVDCTIFGIRKFVKLCRDANPNVLELLFLRQEEILFKDVFMDEILRFRNFFLSQRVIYTYSGYAHSQLQRVKNHKKWIDNPIIKKPMKEDFIHQYRYGSDGLNFLGEYKFDEFGFEAAKKEKQNYDRWVANRNPERFEIEQEHGIDLKHCTHLIRLLKQGLELVRDGVLNVYREEDKDELMGIRNGKMGYDEILEYSDHLESEIMACKEKTPLPHSPNDKAIDSLVTQITDSYLFQNKDF